MKVVFDEYFFLNESGFDELVLYRLTTLDLMQPFVVNNKCSFDLSTWPTQTALTQALSNFLALILSASAIFAMTTSPKGTNADS